MKIVNHMESVVNATIKDQLTRKHINTMHQVNLSESMNKHGNEPIMGNSIFQYFDELCQMEYGELGYDCNVCDNFFLNE